MMISYVIPTRNRAHMVGMTIDSIVRQPYPHKEIIIIDDDSSDNLKTVISEMNVPYLRYIHPGQHIGQNKARNLGIQEAHGDVITIMDSDDYDLGTDLTKIIDVFRTHPNLLGAFTPAVSMSSGQLMATIKRAGTIFGQKGFVDGTYVGEYQMFLRKKDLQLPVFEEDLCIKRSCTMLTWMKLGADHSFMIIDQKTRLYNDIHTERFGTLENTLLDASEITTCYRLILEIWGNRIRELSPRAYNDLIISLSYSQLMSAGRRAAMAALTKMCPAPIGIKKALLTLACIIAGPRLTAEIRRRKG